MHKPTYKYILSFISILAIILACTKDVGLYTEVEFELTETHEIEGYINTALATAITVIPEEIVEGYSYSYSYKINSGAGYFEDESGTIISEGDKIALDPLSASLNYIATTVGDHAIVFTATDSFGFAEQVIATYSITNIPVTWTATGPTNQLLVGDSDTITIVLGSETQAEEVTYQRNYSFIENTGTLTTSEGNNEILDELVDIIPGTYELTFTATELGITTIEFLLEDSNGQELIETISFEVVAEVELSSENTITEFELDGIIVSDPDNNFTITLPSGTDITSLTPTIEHNGVSISPASETSQDFSNPLTYVVTAENDAIQEYIVTVEVEVAESDTNSITSFELEGVTVTNPENEFTITLPADTDISALTPTIQHNGVSINPDNSAQDFSNPVTYVVTAKNDAIQEYIVTVEVEVAESDTNSITSFELEGVTVTNPENEFTITLPAGTDVTALTPTINHNGESINPDNSAQDFSNPVTYTVTAENDDTQEYIVTVELEEENQAPTAVATSDVTSGTSTLEVQFTGDASSDPDGDAITYAWDFGDGSTSTEINPTHSYTTEGTYNASLIVTDNQTPALSSIEATIEIIVTEENQAPIASIIANPLSGTAPLDVLFVGNANDPDGDTLSYAWDFGDNIGTSTEQIPSYTFNNAGIYEVTLTVTDDGNPNLSSVATIEITVTGANNAPTALASGPNTAIKNETVQFTGDASSDPDGDAITYAWDFGDNIGTSTLENPTYSYTVAGIYEVTLIVTDNGTPAMSSTEFTFEIIISDPNQAPTAVASSNVSTGTATLKVQFTGSNSTDDGDQLYYLWDFGDGSTSTEADPLHSFTNAGEYEVLLTVSDDGSPSLSDSDTITITVSEPTPTATFSNGSFIDNSSDSSINPLSGTLTIENGAMTFDVIAHSFSTEEVITGITIVTFEITNTNGTDVNTTQATAIPDGGGISEQTETTPEIPEGVYNYSISIQTGGDEGAGQVVPN